MKYETETDLAPLADGFVGFRRIYNSLSKLGAVLGKQWISTFERSLLLNEQYGISTVIATRPDGRVLYFTLVNGVWTGDSDIRDRLERTSSGWLYSLPDGSSETYSQDGRLTMLTSRQGITQRLYYGESGLPLLVEDSFGHRIRFGYDANGRLETLRMDDNRTIRYQYDSSDRLIRVEYPRRPPFFSSTSI